MAMKKTIKNPTHAIYIGGDAKNVDLIVGKVYRVLKPRKNDLESDVRVIDESQDDYIYPNRWFVPIDLPSKAKVALGSV